MSRAWWRHQMEIFSALLAICAGNSPVPVKSPHKGLSRGALMFTLISPRINGWVNNRLAGDLKRYRPHYDVIVMEHCDACHLFVCTPDYWFGNGDHRYHTPPVLTALLKWWYKHNKHKSPYQIDSLVQDWSNSVANALELLQSCSKPSKFVPPITCYGQSISHKIYPLLYHVYLFLFYYCFSLIHRTMYLLLFLGGCFASAGLIGPMPVK